MGQQVVIVVGGWVGGGGGGWCGNDSQCGHARGVGRRWAGDQLGQEGHRDAALTGWEELVWNRGDRVDAAIVSDGVAVALLGIVNIAGDLLRLLLQPDVDRERLQRNQLVSAQLGVRSGVSAPDAALKTAIGHNIRLHAPISIRPTRMGDK